MPNALSQESLENKEEGQNLASENDMNNQDENGDSKSVNANSENKASRILSNHLPKYVNPLRKDLDDININGITPQEFERYIYSKGISSAFEVIFSEILTKKIPARDQFKYAAGRLREFGRQAGEVISNTHNP